MQDANFNTLGVVSRTGRLIERYEYTPYGQRTVFSHGWLPADFNDDGAVTLADYTIWSNNSGSGTTLDEGDANGDGAVSLSDYTIWSNNYGKDVSFTDDPLTMYPRLGSFVATSDNPMALCDIGHQGLHWQREFQKYDVRTRIEDPVFAIFYQRDPGAVPRNKQQSTAADLSVVDLSAFHLSALLNQYADGMSLYEYERSNSTNRLDPSGKVVIINPGAGLTIFGKGKCAAVNFANARASFMYCLVSAEEKYGGCCNNKVWKGKEYTGCVNYAIWLSYNFTWQGYCRCDKRGNVSALMFSQPKGMIWGKFNQ